MPKTRAVVISDVHIGDGRKTVRYQPALHDPYLSAILHWVLDNIGTIREVVLLGDIVDQWMYPPAVRPPSLATIIEANPRILGRGGLLAEVVAAMNRSGGVITYIRGNHDLNLTDADLAALRAAVGPIAMGPDVHTLVGATGRRTTFAHGHLWTMFNAPDPASRWNKLPLGHFVTRAFAHKMERDLRPGETVAGQDDLGAPNGFSLATFLDDPDILGNSTTSLARLVLDLCARMAKLDENEPILLPDGNVATIREAKVVYDGLFNRWVKTEGPLGAARAARADEGSAYLGWFAQRLALTTGSDLVLFGHTHTAVDGFTCSPVDYVNSGFECASKPVIEAKPPTFAVVDLDAPGAPGSRVLQARRSGSDYMITPATAPRTSVVPARFTDFSCYYRIKNDTGRPLTLTPKRVQLGRWVVPPRDEIAPGATAHCWLHDDVGLQGAGGGVTYTGPGGTFELHVACPVGKDNTVSCSGGTFRTRSADGEWRDDAVDKHGRPVQVQAVVPARRSGTDDPRTDQDG